MPVRAKRPALYVGQLVLSDGTELKLGFNTTVIFVGPNNSGKSAALREIQHLLARNGSGRVIRSVNKVVEGSASSFSTLLKDVSQVIADSRLLKYEGYKFSIRDDEIKDFPKVCDSVRDVFVNLSRTDDRLSGSNPAKSIAYRYESASHPIHLLIPDRNLESEISDAFFEAFGKNLLVYRAGGAEASLHVSDHPTSHFVGREFDKDTSEFFREKSNHLMQQGDGMRAFATIALDAIVTAQQTVILIDEPEAFLHPPQARAIGKLIAKEKTHHRQIFVSTHSSSVLRGIVEGSSGDIVIVRLTRKGDINPAHVLSANSIKNIYSDSLTKYSSIIDAVFHKNVIITESEADVQFYEALLELPQVGGAVAADTLFIYSSGKQRLARLAAVSRDLGIRTAVIVDLDILRDLNQFKNLFEEMGGVWEDIKAEVHVLRQSIDGQRAQFSLQQTAGLIEIEFAKFRSGEIGGKEFIVSVTKSVKSANPWDNVKRGGRSALPQGAIVQTFDRIFEACGAVGLWIVNEGELEGFCRSVPQKGSAWVTEVLERNLLDCDELAGARHFMTRVHNELSKAP